jgi:hypothetical protein
MIDSNLSTGENVSSNSIPSTRAYPLHTNMVVFFIICPFSLSLFLKIHLVSITIFVFWSWDRFPGLIFLYFVKLFIHLFYSIFILVRLFKGFGFYHRNHCFFLSIYDFSSCFHSSTFVPYNLTFEAILLNSFLWCFWHGCIFLILFFIIFWFILL